MKNVAYCGPGNVVPPGGRAKTSATATACREFPISPVARAPYLADPCTEVHIRIFGFYSMSRKGVPL